MTKITLLDSTLRDGAQGEGMSFSESDKRKIIHSLDKLGIDIIEAGMPAASERELAFLTQLSSEPLSYSRLAVFGSTRHKDIAPEKDNGLSALISCGIKTLVIVGKAARSQVENILETTPEENLRMISESISFLTGKDREVIFDAEHFFDGYLEDCDYALGTLAAAIQGGAKAITLCDTNGGTETEDVYRIAGMVAKHFPDIVLGIHCHNDCGLAVASSLRAIDAGATLVQGTLLGFGERCGNTNLCTLIPNLQCKRGLSCIPEANLHLLTPIARRVADISNFSLPVNRPYVGKSAFAHKGGMHIDGIIKEPSSFEHMDPEIVGNRRRILLSEVSGKSGLLDRIRKYDPSLDKDSPKTQEILEQLKALEHRGYQFEAAEESLILLIRRSLGLQKKYFTLDHFKTIGEQPLFGRLHPSSAIVKIRVGEESAISAEEGNGPVNALDLALRKSLSHFYPRLEDMRLTDYKVRVLESDATTAAAVRVLIESTDGKHNFTTIGVSTDIIEASFLALSDSIEYKLTLDDLENDVEGETL